MPTKDKMRVYLLRSVEGFAGRRGRTGVINFLLGEGTPATMALAAEQGISELFAVLKETPQQELQQMFSALERQGALEIKSVNLKDKVLPLVYLTSRGLAELELSRYQLPAHSASGVRVALGILVVLQRLATLIVQLRVAHAEDIPSAVGLSPEQLGHYLQLLCKVLQLRHESVMTSIGSRQHFADVLERALCTMVFAELSEIESQCMRFHIGMLVPYQLDQEGIERYLGVKSITEKVTQGSARLATREWQGKCPLVSVLGFLAIGEVGMAVRGGDDD